MWMVTAPHRKPVSYTEEALEDARRSVERVREFVRRLDPQAGAPGIDEYARAFLRRAGRRLRHLPRHARCSSTGWPRATGASTPARRWDPGRLEEMLHVLGLESLLEAGTEPDAPEELRRLVERA